MLLLKNVVLKKIVYDKPVKQSDAIKPNDINNSV